MKVNRIRQLYTTTDEVCKSQALDLIIKSVKMYTQWMFFGMRALSWFPTSRYIQISSNMTFRLLLLHVLRTFPFILNNTISQFKTKHLPWRENINSMYFRYHIWFVMYSESQVKMKTIIIVLGNEIAIKSLWMNPPTQLNKDLSWIY